MKRVQENLLSSQFHDERQMWDGRRHWHWNMEVVFFLSLSVNASLANRKVRICHGGCVSLRGRVNVGVSKGGCRCKA